MKQNRILLYLLCLALTFSGLYAQEKDSTSLRITPPIVAPEIQPKSEPKVIEPPLWKFHDFTPILAPEITPSPPPSHPAISPQSPIVAPEITPPAPLTQPAISPQSPIVPPETQPSVLPTWNFPAQFTPVNPPILEKFTPGYAPIGLVPSSPILPPDYQNPYNPHAPPIVGFASVAGINMVPQDNYLTAHTTSFTGGINQVDFANQIADNEAVEIQNFVWTSNGMLEKRSGYKFRKDQSSQFEADRRLWGLYTYHAPNGRNMVLSATENGKLYADTNETGTYVLIKDELDSNTNYYHFSTFKGKAIVAHENDYVFSWNVKDDYWKLGLIDTTRVIHNDLCIPDTCEKYTGHTCCNQLILNTNKYTEENELVGYSVALYHSPTHEFARSYIYASGADENGSLYIFTDHTVTDDGMKGEKCWLLSYFNELANITTDGVNDTGTIDSVWVPVGCAVDSCVRVWDTGICDNISTLYHEDYVIQITSGIYTGETRYIWDNDYDWLKIGLHNGTLAGVPEIDTAIYSAGTKFKIFRIGAYKPRLVKIYKNRVFLAGTGGAEGSGQDVILFSENNDINRFPKENRINVRTDDGDHITALATFFDDQLGFKDESKDCLVILKENSLWKLVWNSSTDYYLVQVSPNIGCVAPQTVVNVEGRFLLFLHTTGVYAFDGRSVVCVSKKIQPTIETINENIWMAAATYYDRHYYLSYPDGAYTRCNKVLVFNTDFGSWATGTNPIGNIYAPYNPVGDTNVVLFTDPLSKSRIFEYGSAVLDAGVEIPLTYKSKAFDFDEIHKVKLYRYFDLDYFLDTGNFGAQFYTDWGDSLRYDTTVTDVGGYRYVRIPLNEYCIGSNLSYKLTLTKDLKIGKGAITYRKIKE